MPRAWIRLRDFPRRYFIEGRYYGFKGQCTGLEATLRCDDARTGTFTNFSLFEPREIDGLIPDSQFYRYCGTLTDPKKIEESFKKHLTRTTKRDTLKNQEAGNV